MPFIRTRTVIIVLLLNMVNDKTSYPLKYASLYCFKVSINQSLQKINLLLIFWLVTKIEHVP